jgi:hypothetical protein
VLSLGALPESNARLTPLLVSEWDHRLALLELFKMMHKGIFFRCLPFSSMQRRILDRIAP